MAGKNDVEHGDRGNGRHFDDAFAVDHLGGHRIGGIVARRAAASTLEQYARLLAQHKVGHRAARSKSFGGDAGQFRGFDAGYRVRREKRHGTDPGDRFGAALGCQDGHAGFEVFDSAETLCGFNQGTAGDSREGFFELRQSRGDAGSGFHQAFMGQPGGFIATGQDRGALRARGGAERFGIGGNGKR
jgi:hypothetical protein